MNKSDERQPLLRADQADAGSSVATRYGHAFHNHDDVVVGNSEYVSANGSLATERVQEPTPTTAVFKRRWYIIFVFSLGNFIQAMAWNTWGPITESAEVTFDWQDSNIGMLANYGNIAFMVTVIPMCYFMDVKGLRISLIICGFLLALGCGIRCITMEPAAMTWLSNGGALLIGFGGSVPFAGPAKLSAVWFPPNQRTTATSIASFSNYLGIAMAFIIGPAMVQSPRYGTHNGTVITSTLQSSFDVMFYGKNASNTSNTDVVNANEVNTDIRHLMYLHAALAGLFFLLVLVYFPDKPPIPPSPTAAMERTEWLKGLRHLVTNKALWLVVSAGAISAGVQGVWISVLDVNLKPHGISQHTAGYMGFWQTMAGCTAGLLIAKFSDLFMRHMKMFLIVLFIGAILAVVWFTAMCEQYIPFNIPCLYAACVLIGVFINGGIPLFYEISCEASYPVAEGVTGGLMTFVNNLVGIGFLFIMLIKNIGLVV
ncbi:hypothetical protein DPMN_078505 [Dreissena polymorpha]|uniref:Uncharacterized protein n=1 Tax=Dreissena polymorpha TaxID=45954 RepID=A0A9D3YMC6_DREPO|nr:hypothetical protein DPMN_078505 [Dreissena polymorpha]